jgi:hypothetical protein
MPVTTGIISLSPVASPGALNSSAQLAAFPQKLGETAIDVPEASKPNKEALIVKL